MRLVFSILVLLIFPASVQAQDYLSKAAKIRDISSAQSFADSIPQVVLGFLHDEMENEDYQVRKDTLKPGDIYESGAYHVVNIAEGSKEIYRFRLLTITKQRTENPKETIEALYTELENGATFEKLFDEYAQNNGPDAKKYGDVGWVDLDFFVDSFKSDVKDRKKGERFIAGDEASGWFNIVEMTHKSRKMKGHYVLLIPRTNTNNFFSNINHHKNVLKLKTREEMQAYSEKYPGDVLLELLYNLNKPELYKSFEQQSKMVSKEEFGIISKDQRNYKFIRDTILQLYSIQYVYLNGSSMSRDARTEAIHDIYDQFHSNVPFDSIVAQYWPDNKGYSTLRNIDGGLLAKDLAAKIDETTVGQLFVARVGQSYFIGVPLEKTKSVPAVLVLSYPKSPKE